VELSKTHKKIQRNPPKKKQKKKKIGKTKIERVITFFLQAQHELSGRERCRGNNNRFILDWEEDKLKKIGDKKVGEIITV
jgi:hypothetical protein